MPESQTADPRVAVVERIQSAINQHDLAALVDCFAADVDSQQPAHPDRGFRGQDQLRENWSRILGGAPDLHADLLRSTAAGDAVWAEWAWRGTRAGGGAFAMSGVTLQGVSDGRVSWVRFYMEPVQRDGVPVSAAIEQQIAPAEK